MRVAAGVLILVVAVMNLMGGCTYTLGGGLMGGAANEGGIHPEEFGHVGMLRHPCSERRLGRVSPDLKAG